MRINEGLNDNLIRAVKNSIKVTQYYMWMYVTE